MDNYIELTFERPEDYILARIEFEKSDFWQVTWGLKSQKQEHRSVPFAFAKKYILFTKKDLKDPVVKIELLKLAIKLLSGGILYVIATFGKDEGKLIINDQTKIEIHVHGDMIFKDDSATIEKLKKLIDE